MPVRSLAPEDMRDFGRAIGHDLLEHHGKQDYYTVDQVNSSAKRQGYAPDWSCWAMSGFVEPAEFIAYHADIGETCDLPSMKSQLVEAITDGASSSWFDADLSWLDWPDIDPSVIFDFLDWG